MVWLSAEQVAASVMIERLIVAWARDLDRHGGVNIGPLLTEDTVYMCRGAPRHGREATVGFYVDRAAELAGRAMTMRHAVSNLMIDFGAPDRARVDFLLTYYHAESAPPVTRFPGPLALADVWMDVACGGDGHWRIASFDSVQNFIRTEG